MEAKFTSGRWTADAKSDVRMVIRAWDVNSEDCVLLARVAYDGWDIESGNITKEECVANRALVASSPRLYKALENMLSIEGWDKSHPHYVEAVAALAEARGETP